MEEIGLFPSYPQWVLDGFIIPDDVVQGRIKKATKNPENPVKASEVLRKVDIPVPPEVLHYVAELCRSMCLSILVLDGPQESYTLELGGRERIYANPDMGPITQASITRIDGLLTTRLKWREAA
jgi:hypothetical protein